MSSLLRSLRYSLRMIVRRPGLSATAIVALGLGIGLTTTMFSIVYFTTMRGLPFEDSEELVAVFRNRPAQDVAFMGVSIHDYNDWRERQTSFEEIAAYFAETVNLGSSDERPVRYLGAYVSAHLFDVLGVQPVLGRTFLPEEDHPSTPPVMILSYRAWQDRFGGDPGVIGQTVRANAEVTTIVGVMPEKFGFPSQMDAWLPLRIDPLAYVRGGGPALEGTQLNAIARLRDGRTLEDAQAEMSAIAADIEREHPESNSGIGVALIPQIDTLVGPEASTMLYVMLAAVFGVLLIACANVANLLFARTLVRSKEVAIRTALGANRMRTVAQLLGETLVLSAAGALVGLVLAKIGIDFFNATLATQEQPLWFVASLDPAVIAFVVGLTLLSTLMAGTLPALRASREKVSGILRDESRGSSGVRVGRISKVLVVAQIAVSCCLLVGSGLMVRTVMNIASFDYGFDTENVFTARLGLFENDYPTEQSQLQFYESLEERLMGRPGVEAVAFTSDLPARGGQTRPISVQGVAYQDPSDHPLAYRIVVTPGFFDIVESGVVAGRTFNRLDGPDAQPVAIVNERFAELILGGQDPLGMQIRLDEEGPWRTIVGVVPDLNLGGAAGSIDPRHQGVYVPLSQNVINFMSLVVRTQTAPMTQTAMIQDQVESLDPALPLYWVRSLEQQYALDTWFFRTFGALFMAFGIAALTMATIGLYGVMSFSTGNRRREFGLRMALGADAPSVLRLILKMGVVQVGLGLAIGVALAALLAQALGILLFGVRPWDPTVFAGVITALTLTGLAACIIPAQRATRVDPVEAMR